MTVHEGIIVPSRSPKANVKSLFYFSLFLSQVMVVTKINAREESNFVVLSIAAYGS